jgi:hypothetical protein
MPEDEDLTSMSVRDIDRRLSMAEGRGRRPPKNKDGSDQVSYGSKANLKYRARLKAELRRRTRSRITPKELRERNPEVREGFEEALPSEMHISELRRNSPFGSFSPKAAVMDATNEAMTALSGEETARGRRHAETAARLKTKPKKKGGVIRGMKGGGKVRGAGKVKKGVRPAKIVKMKG